MQRLQPRPRPPTRGSTPCTRVTTKQWCRVMPWVGAHPVLEAHPILRLLLTIISVGAPGVNRDSRLYPHLPLWLICNSIHLLPETIFKNKYRVKNSLPKNEEELKKKKTTNNFDEADT